MFNNESIDTCIVNTYCFIWNYCLITSLTMQVLDFAYPFILFLKMHNNTHKVFNICSFLLIIILV